LRDTVEWYLTAIDGMDTTPGSRYIGVCEPEVFENRPERWVNLAGIGVANVVAVDEGEWVVLMLNKREI
jgi:hypothetical protein